MVTLPEKLDIAAGYASELEETLSIGDWFNEKFLKKLPVKIQLKEFDENYKETPFDSVAIYDILENLIAGVIQTDIHGTVHFFNSAASKMFDYETNEIIGKNVDILVPKLSRINAEFEREITCVRKNKSIFLSSFDASKIVVHGEYMLFTFLNYVSE